MGFRWGDIYLWRRPCNSFPSGSVGSFTLLRCPSPKLVHWYCDKKSFFFVDLDDLSLLAYHAECEHVYRIVTAVFICSAGTLPNQITFPCQSWTSGIFFFIFFLRFQPWPWPCAPLLAVYFADLQTQFVSSLRCIVLSPTPLQHGSDPPFISAWVRSRQLMSRFWWSRSRVATDLPACLPTHAQFKRLNWSNQSLDWSEPFVTCEFRASGWQHIFCAYKDDAFFSTQMSARLLHRDTQQPLSIYQNGWNSLWLFSGELS